MNAKNNKNVFNRVLKRYFPDAQVSWDDLLLYLSAYKYEDDKYGIDDIFGNDYLLLHEIYEISCLKRGGLRIDRNVIIKNRETVYHCHLRAMDFEIDKACEEGKKEHVRRRIKDLKSYLTDPHLPENLRNEVKKIIEKYAICSNFGVYALLIYNPKDQNLKIGSLGTIHFPEGYYVYIGSAQRGLRKRIERHYSSEKNLKWHIDYFLRYAKPIDHFSLPLPRTCEEIIAIWMQNYFEFVKNFGSSDSHASSHLFYDRKYIWEKVKSLFWKCILK